MKTLIIPKEKYYEYAFTIFQQAMIDHMINATTVYKNKEDYYRWWSVTYMDGCRYRNKIPYWFWELNNKEKVEEFLTLIKQYYPTRWFNLGGN